jgi:hypothetical protein
MKKIGDFHLSYPEMGENDRMVIADAFAIIKKEFSINGMKIYNLNDVINCDIKFMDNNREITLTMFVDTVKSAKSFEKILTIHLIGNNHYAINNKENLIKRLDYFGVPRKGVNEKLSIVDRYMK